MWSIAGSVYHLQRLSLMHTLDSHKGCVNTVAWNEAGTLLLSGSDDRRLIVTDPFSRSVYMLGLSDIYCLRLHT